MSFNEGIEVKLHKRRVLDADIAGYLINNPNCLDNNTEKEKAYQIAIDYFISKQEESKPNGESVSCNWAEAIKLGLLIDEYVESEGKEDKQRTYAVKIAQYLLDTTKYFLSMIPDETKNMAFQIVIQYLDTAMRS